MAEAKKRKLSWWWFLLIPCLLLAILFAQILGPNPPLKIGPTTIVISEPLTEDGMPDYGTYVMQRYSEGVTPENNAAVLFWRAHWSDEIMPELQRELVEVLEMDWPSPSESLELAYDQMLLAEIDGWLLKRYEDTSQEALDAEDTADQIIGEAMESPWVRSEMPVEVLDAWAERNQ